MITLRAKCDDNKVPDCEILAKLKKIKNITEIRIETNQEEYTDEYNLWTDFKNTIYVKYTLAKTKEYTEYSNLGHYLGDCVTNFTKIKKFKEMKKALSFIFKRIKREKVKISYCDYEELDA